MPDESATDTPKSLFDKVGAALPVALTVVATAFAGMSSSEMSQAMYWRSAAAQDQSKASNQWGFATAKRDRALICSTTAAQLRATVNYQPMKPVTGDTPAVQWLNGNGPPKVDLPAIEDQKIQDVLDAVRDRKSEEEVVRLAKKAGRDGIDKAINTAEVETKRIDDEWSPILKEVEKLVGKPGSSPADSTVGLAAKYDVEDRRYRAEARLNQGIGYLYEVRTKVSVAESDKHRSRSKNFFYAMLVAQVGATIASLGLARKQKSVLWLIAGIAGIVAVGFGAYIYLDLDG